jgi:hypothetical protein
MIGMVFGLGLAMVMYGWLRPPQPPRRRSQHRGRLARQLQIRILLGFSAGLVVWLASGWWVALAAIPAAIVGVPALLAAPSRNEIQRLEALEEWTRSLASVLTVGVGIEQAIVATTRSAPAAIAREVGGLAARLSARTPTEVALRRFADDLADATGDLVVMSLLLGASRRGSGLSTVLNGLADSVSDEVRIRRAVEADRAKLRTASRWITGITLVVLGGLFWNGDYVAPYHSTIGQMILVLQLAAYAGALVWLRSMAAGRPPARLLTVGGRA